MTDILRRSLAPITQEAWEEIDEEAARILKLYLAGRQIVDLNGPRGWQAAAVNLGRLDYDENKKSDGVEWAERRVLPLIEIRVPFELEIFELDDVTRGCADADLDPLTQAAIKTALFEDKAILKGFAEGQIKGISEACPHKPIELSDKIEELPVAVAKGIEELQLASIDGPYALVLEPKRYHALMQSTKTGYPLRRVIRDMVQGSVLWSAAIEGGVLVSMRGGDFELNVGQDLSIGYWTHTAKKVELYLTESFTFRAIEPAAGIVLA